MVHFLGSYSFKTSFLSPLVVRWPLLSPYHENSLWQPLEGHKEINKLVQQGLPGIVVKVFINHNGDTKENQLLLGGRLGAHLLLVRTSNPSCCENNAPGFSSLMQYKLTSHSNVGILA